MPTEASLKHALLSNPAKEPDTKCQLWRLRQLPVSFTISIPFHGHTFLLSILTKYIKCMRVHTHTHRCKTSTLTACARSSLQLYVHCTKRYLRVAGVCVRVGVCVGVAVWVCMSV
jgi:hypothetical protein